MNYRFISIAGLILTVLLAIDGLFMVISNYKPDDTSNNTLHMSDGVTVLVAAGLLLIVTIVAFVLSRRSQSGQSAVDVKKSEEPSPEVQG
ncbi:MAG TPA: hypothetical protein VKR06_01720 [Ktedonosporobacter sp.]|nr:hypothetical protein [Ktedonosporobacter sp.]